MPSLMAILTNSESKAWDHSSDYGHSGFLLKLKKSVDTKVEAYRDWGVKQKKSDKAESQSEEKIPASENTFTEWIWTFISNLFSSPFAQDKDIEAEIEAQTSTTKEDTITRRLWSRFETVFGSFFKKELSFFQVYASIIGLNFQ